MTTRPTMERFLAGEPVTYEGLAEHTGKTLEATWTREPREYPVAVLRVHVPGHRRARTFAMAENEAMSFYLNLDTLPET